MKLAGIRTAGAETILAGETFDEAEAHAQELATRSGRTYVSAYDDPWVIAGQGTIALEILDQLGEPPGVFLAPMSGGGLAGGMAVAFDQELDEGRPRAVAVSAENAAVMVASLDAGKPVELPERDTLANALAGGIGLDNKYSFDLVRDRVDEHVVVSERQIADAMAHAIARLGLVVEGAGAVALAALLAGAWVPAPHEGDAVVIVLSGGNVSAETLISVMR